MTRCMDGAGGQKKNSAARLFGMVPASMDGWLHVVGIGLAAFEPFTRKLGASEW